jgi:hypothetical protein
MKENRIKVRIDLICKLFSLPDQLSTDIILFMRLVDIMISSKTGTLPPTRPKNLKSYQNC